MRIAQHQGKILNVCGKSQRRSKLDSTKRKKQLSAMVQLTSTGCELNVFAALTLMLKPITYEVLITFN